MKENQKNQKKENENNILKKYGVKPNVSGTKTNDVLKLITDFSQKTINALKNGEKLRDGENCLSYDKIAQLVHSPKRQPIQHLIKRIILNKNNPIVRCVLPVTDKKQPIYIPLNLSNTDNEIRELILNNIDTDKPEDKATSEKLKGF